VLGSAALALIGGLAAGNVFDRSVAETTARHSTFQWRLIGWIGLLHSDHSAAAMAFGFPFGTGYRRIVDGGVVNTNPHSLYVGTLLRLGVIGLVALAFLYWNVWKYRHQAADSLDVTPLTVALLLVGFLVFSITYEPGFFASSLIAGLLVWELLPEPQSEAPARLAGPVLEGGP
jgi:hypothetical protein